MRREMWAILTALLGLNLWILLCWGPFQIEWAAEDARPLALVTYLLPLLLVIAGTATRWAIVLLLMVPASLALAFGLLPELDQQVYTLGSGWFSLALGLTLYIVAAARWCRTRPITTLRPPPTPLAADRQTPPDPSTTPRDGRDLEAEPLFPSPKWARLWRPYRGHFIPRMVALLGLLAVIVYGLNFADGIAQTYLDAFQAQAAQAQVMANLVFLFLWIVVAYLFFLSPGLNLELEQRDMDRALEHYRVRAMRSPSIWRFALAAFVTVGLMVALTLFTNAL